MVLASSDGSWKAEDVELDDAGDLDDVVELVRQVAGDDTDALLMVEEDDEWFAVLRVGEDDVRGFVSDARVVDNSEIGALFVDVVDTPAAAADDEDDDEGDTAGTAEDDDGDAAGAPVGDEPAGDSDLLADLGTPSRKLLTLCAQEGRLPGDVLSELCEAAGCLDEMEQLRGH
jgi:putative tRNA adenosine deaminase-associated protein